MLLGRSEIITVFTLEGSLWENIEKLMELNSISNRSVMKFSSRFSGENFLERKLLTHMEFHC